MSEDKKDDKKNEKDDDQFKDEQNDKKYQYEGYGGLPPYDPEIDDTLRKIQFGEHKNIKSIKTGLTKYLKDISGMTDKIDFKK